MNIEKILESIGKDILTDEVKKALAESFNEAVESKTKSQIELVVENELKKLDDEHSDKLQKLIEAIDEDHTKKFKAVIQKLDETHTQKLEKVIEKYEQELKKGADTLREELIAKVSNYLDLYLTESIPADQLKEAVQNIRAKKMINEIKKIVAVDEEFISENFKDALKDGHDTIEKLKGELNKAIKESTEIKQELIQTKATVLLEQKTKDLPENKRKYISKLLEGKKPEEIEENFKFVLEMYEKDEADKVETLKESETAKSKTVTAKVQPPKSIVTEGVKDDGVENSDASRVSSYMKGFEQ